MTAIYECATCGVVSRNDEELCAPRKKTARQSYCGTSPERGAMCRDIRERLSFVCGICGRPAEQAGLVCNPLVVGCPDQNPPDLFTVKGAGRESGK